MNYCDECDAPVSENHDIYMAAKGLCDNCMEEERINN